MENLATNSTLVFLPSVVRAPFKLLVKKLKMVPIKFFVVLIAVSCESKKSLMPQAILQLVQSNYGERPVVIEVFYTSRKVKIVDETLKLLNGVKKLKVTPINITEIILMGPRKFLTCSGSYKDICALNYLNDGIFLFDTLDNYQIWRNKFIITPINGGRSLNHLVYCEDASQEAIELITLRKTYESYLIEKNHQVSLHAITMFSKKQCRPRHLVEINQFSSLERKWKTEKFFRPRIENFHGCTMVLDFFYFDAMPFLKYYETEAKTWLAEGAIIDMLNELSIHLNFTYLYGPAADKYALKMGFYEPMDYEDLQIGAKLLYGEGSPSSYPIASTADVVSVPPGQLFTSWEKLLMPFDRQTWMWLGIVFAVAFLVILLIKLSKSTSMYDFVVGSNVSTPSLNVMAIFMGIGQILLPERNVSRFFFMNFILFSLIMRTAYQGKYFEFLTTDIERKPIQTIEELKDKNFTAIAYDFHCLFFYCYDEDILTG